MDVLEVAADIHRARFKGSILIASIQVEPIEPLFDAALVWFTSSSIIY
jgi:hypothetical protein